MNDHRIETILGNLLRIGVLLAAVTVLAGGAAYLIQHCSDPADYHHFVAGGPGTRTLSGIVQSAMHFQSEGWMQLGLLFLIATPVARVVMALVGFAMEQDRLYTAVSAIVLAILTFSLMHAS